MEIQGVYVEDLNKDTLLYAGAMTIRITDWFFLKDKAIIHHAELDDTFIHINRTDSVWNYQFLVDYFSSPTKSSAKKKKGIEIDLKELRINRLRFLQTDQWIGKDTRGEIKELNLSAENIDLNNKRINLKELILDEPLFSLRNYPGRRIKPAVAATAPGDSVIAPAVADTATSPGWEIVARKLVLKNGSFLNDKETDRPPYPGRFDGQHLYFSAINATMDQVVYKNGAITTRLDFSAKERSGLDIKTLKAAVKVDATQMEFDSLELKINNSTLGNYYAMRYNDFNADMSDFIHAVTLEARFTNSTITSDDLALFAPALKSWKKTFQLEGNASGTIDNLKAKQMKIKSGATSIDGDITIRGLPTINETFIDFKGNDVQTNYTDLSMIIPSLKNTRAVRLDLLGNIKYKGNFTGFVNDFVAFGSFQTNLGNLSGDLNMKLLPGQPAVYNGKLNTAGFQLGRFLGNSQLGLIALNGDIKGRGFNAKDINAAFNGKFSSFEYRGYRYQNISLNSTLAGNVFSGKASINDPNLSLSDFEGSINMAGNTPSFNFDATLANANFKALGFTKDDFSLGGRFSLDFTGDNIDNFLGKARIYEANLKHNGQRLSFDSLTLNSLLLSDGRKQLSLQSNEADAVITGNFRILELPDAFSYFLSNYFPAYIRKPTKVLSAQSFDFNIETKKIDDYVRLLGTRISGFNESDISGSLRLADNLLDLTATVPQFSYDDKKFLNTKISGQGNSDSLTGLLEAEDIILSDSLHFPDTRIDFASSNDLSRVAIKTSANKTLSKAELNATIQTFSDGIKVHFYPSSFIINEKTWQLEKDGELVIRKSVFDASEVKFVQGQQEITISTEPSAIGTSTDIIAKLKNINISDFVPLVTRQPRLEGVFSGTLKVIDPFGKPEFELEEGIAENFVLNDKPLGNVFIKNTRLTNKDILALDVSADNQYAKFDIKGQISLKDSSDKMVDLTFTSERVSLDMLEPYLGTVFSNMSGNVVSDLRFTSSPTGKNALVGSVNITNGAMRVKYTQCLYKFTNETILFNPGEIDFGSMTLTDTLKNTGSLTGKIYHNSFKDFSFDDVHLNTSRMLLLNTQKKDNDQFYGKVIGAADLKINGGLNNLRMDISGEPSRIETDSNHIYLPGGSGREEGTIDYLEFIQFGTEMESQLKAKEGTNMVINMDIKANPSCKVDVILDEVTGDVIRGEGEGQLKITVRTGEGLSIRGRYNLTKGSYDFNFQSVLKRPFALNNGYINWTGDPYEAEINIDAEYTATKVDFSAITSNRNQTGDVKVVAHLTQTLKKPAINLEFMIPSTDALSSDFLVNKKLEEYKKDPTEMNKQVSSVLLFNSFITSDQSFFGAGNSYSFATNTLGQILSAFLTNNFSRFLQRALNDPNVSSYIDITSRFDLKQSFDAIQAAARFGIVKSYLNGRLIISLGGNLDYSSVLPNGNAVNANLLLTPDFSLEWLLSKDGNIRIVGFRRTNIDWAYGQRNRQGVSLSFKKDFDKFSELFSTSDSKLQRRESRRKRQNTNTPPPAAAMKPNG